MTEIESAQKSLDAEIAKRDELREKRAAAMRQLAQAEADPTDPESQARRTGAKAAVIAIGDRLERQNELIDKARQELADVKARARRVVREIEQIEKAWTPRFDALPDLERLVSELWELAQSLHWPEIQELAQRARGLTIGAQRQQQGLANGRRGLEVLGDPGAVGPDHSDRWSGRGYDYGASSWAERDVRLQQIDRARQNLQDAVNGIPTP